MGVWAGEPRCIERNYSHFGRIICFIKGLTAKFLLNSSLGALKTRSDLQFSKMLFVVLGFLFFKKLLLWI